jgi:hypothetical protein
VIKMKSKLEAISVILTFCFVFGMAIVGISSAEDNPLALVTAVCDSAWAGCVDSGDSIWYIWDVDQVGWCIGELDGLVVVLELPPEAIFVSATDGSYSSATHSIVWGCPYPISCGMREWKDATVTIGPTATPGSTISCTATFEAIGYPPHTKVMTTKICGPPVPEFPTIAIPIAGVLGLVFVTIYRQHRRE